jgi:magnesium transporter
MIVDCALYRAGHRVPEPVADLSEALELARTSDNDFVWIGLKEPTAEEFADVERELNLHPLAVEDVVKAHQRPKSEVYGDTLFVVLKTIRYIDSTELIETGEIAAFLGAGFIVTVRHGDGSPLSDVRHRIEANELLLKCGPSAVLYAVCDKIVDDYIEVTNALQDDIEQIEVEVFGGGRRSAANRIYNLKRETLEFRRAVVPLTPVLQRLVRGELPVVHEEAEPFFRDVLDHNLRAAETVESFDSLLSSVLQANLSQLTVRQNDDMRRISAWVAIAAVPTALAGIWGMNFRHMPELGWEYGYLIAIGVMFGICVLLYTLFKRSHWL